MLDATITIPIFTQDEDDAFIHLGDWTVSLADLTALREDPSLLSISVWRGLTEPAALTP